MEREIKKIITPVDAIEVEIKSWVSGREKRNIQSVFINDVNVGEEGKVKIGGDKLAKYQDGLIENIIVSVGGVKEKVLDLILEMKSKDCDFVINEITEVVNDKEIDSEK